MNSEFFSSDNTTLRWVLADFLDPLRNIDFDCFVAAIRLPICSYMMMKFVDGIFKNIPFQHEGSAIKDLKIPDLIMFVKRF